MGMVILINKQIKEKNRRDILEKKRIWEEEL